MSTAKDPRELVKEAYGNVARERSSCCDGATACCAAPREGQQPVPEAELGLSCGDPVAFSFVGEGDVVLDLGSGGGKDVFLAATKVGPSGKAIGVDMTPEMLELAHRNAERYRERTGLDNVEFREGHIEELPVEDGTVDLAISNCVINLSPDKPRVFREVFRVLRPGGSMVVSDIVLNRELPEAARNSDLLYASCVAGALRREQYLAAIRDAGFATVEVLKDVTLDAADDGRDPIAGELGEALRDAVASITVKATKA